MNTRNDVMRSIQQCLYKAWAILPLSLPRFAADLGCLQRTNVQNVSQDELTMEAYESARISGEGCFCLAY